MEALRIVTPLAFCVSPTVSIVLIDGEKKSKQQVRQDAACLLFE